MGDYKYLGHSVQQCDSRISGEVHLETPAKELKQQCGEEGEVIQNEGTPACVFENKEKRFGGYLSVLPQVWQTKNVYICG